MVGTSKILTVSYGTFSCTLEGFDDSFDTMKAIAEYFRGLAADDRYFGAEPPTPDAELLAKIAEREISRRVDARMDDDGIVLRAAALTDQSAPKVDEDVAAKEAEAAERRAAKKARRAKRAKAKAEAEALAKEEAEAAKAKEEAEKADADAKSQAEADAKAEAEQAQAEAEAHAAAEAEAEALAAAEAEAEALAAAERKTAVEDETLSSDINFVEEAAQTTVYADPSSVAAKLQRIRAVVGDSVAPLSDDLSEQFLPQSETPDVADTAETTDPVEEFDSLAAEHTQNSNEAAQSELDASTADGPDMIARVMAGQTDDVVQDETPETADVETVTKEANEVDATPIARVVHMKRADYEASIAGNETIDETVPESVEGPNLGLLDGADDLDEYLEDSDYIDADLGMIDDLDLASDLKNIADETTSDVSEDSAEVDTALILNAVSNTVAGALEPDVTDVNDTASETDEAETDPIEEDQPQDIEAEVDVESDTQPHGFLAEGENVEDSSLDRLMSETDAQMQEPEGSRRRNAIAQLKAAVAAKEAARQVGETDDDGQDVENAFRNDLTEVTPEGAPRPRPVVRKATRTERPRPAPLKLVAAQRVDVAETVQRDGPVTPRRVSANSADASEKNARSFEEFADKMGARELPDLLEAAAAYTAFVEGVEEFSRPQILRRVRTVASDGFKREDGLRSFADLLSTGRLSEVSNGRFQLADDSRFNPERAAS